MRSIRIAAPAVLAVLVAATGCTPTQREQAPGIASPQPLLSSRLTCEDAWEGGPPPAPEAPSAEGVSSLAWAGSPANYSWPIRNEMNGYPYTGGRGTKYGAWKTPITVAAGSGERIITIDSPSDASLIIASATEWETSEALREGELDLPDSYTVSACKDRPTQFPGMTLVQGPACVVIRVTENATGKFSTVSVPMYGGTCS
ncbi:hypothetical protein ARZXY2_4843 (plasmid) [Arthrobacter sp. ZXY-2]|nr:hypothetical protein ARZXY2_4843 [Arthrobacter sp. ZXY-2]